MSKIPEATVFRGVVTDAMMDCLHLSVADEGDESVTLDSVLQRYENHRVKITIEPEGWDGGNDE